MRDAEDVIYRGRRRWNGNHGKVWWDGLLLFEISKFEAKVTAQREDVIIGNSVDSKITGLKGEGSFAIKSVVFLKVSVRREEESLSLVKARFAATPLSVWAALNASSLLLLSMAVLRSLKEGSERNFFINLSIRLSVISLETASS